jgi:hypothetical protein
MQRRYFRHLAPGGFCPSNANGGDPAVRWNLHLVAHRAIGVAEEVSRCTRPGPLSVSPNPLHHLFLAEWKSAYPTARLHAPSGLRRKRKDLSCNADLSDGPEPNGRPIGGAQGRANARL